MVPRLLRPRLLRPRATLAALSALAFTAACSSTDLSERSPALAACVGIGFLAGSIVTNAAAALAIALGSLVFLDLARSVARGFDLEGALPTAYLPSPLGDTSFLKLYADVAQGISNSTFDHADTALSVPLAWCLASFALALVVLGRRAMP